MPCNGLVFAARERSTTSACRLRRKPPWALSRPAPAHRMRGLRGARSLALFRMEIGHHRSDTTATAESLPTSSAQETAMFETSLKCTEGGAVACIVSLPFNEFPRDKSPDVRSRMAARVGQIEQSCTYEFDDKKNSRAPKRDHRLSV